MSRLMQALGYLGLVEQYDEYDEYDDFSSYDDLGEEPPPLRPPEPAGGGAGAAGARTEASNVRRIAPARADRGPAVAPPDDGYDERPRGGDTRYESATVRVREPERRQGPGANAGAVHITNPTTFNDVEEVGDRFRNGIPVIMNLAGATESVAKRMLDFASGLIFALDGRIERVGDRVFLLTPPGVDVSSEERRRLGERGFFNQA